jgi:hypothetical protein
VLTISGSSQTTYIYMGDAWDTEGTAASNYVWLPMTVNTGSHAVTLQDYAYWKVSPTTGVVTTSSTGKRYEAEDAVIYGRAGKHDNLEVLVIMLGANSGSAVTDCQTCVSKRSVHKSK